MLNVGSGEHDLDGFVNLDLPEFDMRHKWPIEPNTVDYIHMSHVLEHVNRHEAIDVLYWAKQVLKVRGVIHIAVPDMDKFIDCRLSGDNGPLEGYVYTDLNTFLGGGLGEKREHYRHKYMYNFGSLHWVMHHVCGFRNVAMVERNAFDNPKYYAISLYVEGVK